MTGPGSLAAALPSAARQKRPLAALLAAVLPALALVLALAGPARAQGVVPVDDAAEAAFASGVAAFEDGDFGSAYRRFREAFEAEPDHRKTTAAYLMAGLALYRMEAYDRAAALLQDFVEAYPTSSYVPEARRTRELALRAEALAQDGDDVIRLGLLLPLGGNDAAPSQQLFNGIRLAVDEHNAAGGRNRPVQMLFRDTDRDPQQTAAAVAELARAGADVIVGPLFSDEAKAAARAAEDAGVVLVAPLATDEEVSDGRRYVFQANPTIEMRGRLMARFALRGLRMETLGVVAQYDDQAISERMAEGFQDEALRLGGETVFYQVLPDAGAWGRLGDYVSADTLSLVDGVYMPVAGGSAVRTIGSALSELDRLGVETRVLGNSRWHDLPMNTQASIYRTTYTNDFYVDPADGAVAAFQERYRDLAGQAAERLPFVGYDVTRYLLGLLNEASDAPLGQRLREAPTYQGLGMRIDFAGGNVNEAMFYFRYRDGRLELLR